MSGFNQVLIGGYPSGGLTTDKKPLMLANEAYSELRNAYVWRERTIKRLGTKNVGQLKRTFLDINFFLTGAANWTFNLLAVSGYVAAADNANPGKITTKYPHHLTTGDKVIITGIVGATGYNNVTFTITVVDSLNFTVGVNAAAFGAYVSGGFWISNRSLSATALFAQLVPGAFSITFGGNTYTDNGTGDIIDAGSVVVGSINYTTGTVILTNTGAGGAATVISYSYYPGLQVMGILTQDVSTTGIEQTIYFDTRYAYQFISGTFQELSPGTSWTAPNNANGTNTFFFWGTNFQGTTPNLRFFFVTNDYINPSASLFDPIRYYNPVTGVWTNLTPAVDATNFLFQAQILIPYYGRLLALNTWEGTAVAPGTAVNYFARCRFSQIGNPIAADAWRTDIFGKGGFLDAPTNEAIVSVAFFRNTLIVFFEYSTWQLRYLGEYGLPFIFERVSSDFGCESTFSPIIFDQGVLNVSDRGITEASASGVKRIDEQIPQTVFSFEIADEAPTFVHGIRDFEREIVYWNYLDRSDAAITQVFPTTTLLFNYRNNTWAQFRDTITCFGRGDFQFGITWESFTTSWESDASWESSDDQDFVDYVVSGNQLGFIHIFENPMASTPVFSPVMFGQSLFITAVDFTAHPTKLTIPNHNLANHEIIYLSGLMFVGTDPELNDIIYEVHVVDQNNITLRLWNGVGYEDVDKISSATYIGGGYVTLLPKMNLVGKDFNPYQGEGKQFKLSYVDFQMDSNLAFPAIAAVTVQLFVNAYLSQANLVVANQEVNNGSQLANFITNAFQTNPCIIESPGHSLQTGQEISIANVQGMTQVNSPPLYTVTVINSDRFSLDGIDATGFSAYVKDGIWNTTPTDGQVYIPGSQYAWYRFYSTQFGQYLRIALTYDDVLMNQLATHQFPMELNAMNCWFRQGGRLMN